MTKNVTFELPVDTGMFTPLQMHPRAAFGLHMSGWAHWLREHWVPFPRLIRERRLGVVILSLDLVHHRPFRFFDANGFVATAAMTAQEDGGRLFLRTDVTPVGSEATAFAMTAVLRPVQIADGATLSAAPTQLVGADLERFPVEAAEGSGWRRRLAGEVTALEQNATLVACHSRSRTMHRHLCEAADQWSGIALPDLTTQGREELAEQSPDLTGAFSLPLRRITLEFHRPAFFLDQFGHETRAYAVDGGLAFTHHLTTQPGGDRLATCVEWLTEPTTSKERPA